MGRVGGRAAAVVRGGKGKDGSANTPANVDDIWSGFFGRRFPPVSELLSQPGFPDPLVMSDGRRVTTREQWFNERRPELIALFQQINDQFPHWFNARFKEFNDRADRLPFDQHCLVALCAPRPVLFTNGRQDLWINPEGQFEVWRAAAPVYRLFGTGDFSATELPPDGKLIDSRLGYFIRPGGHSLRPEDWTAFLDFADQHLGQPAKSC